MNTKFTVYWMSTEGNGKKQAGYLETTELKACLKTMETLRTLPGVSAIAMCSECTDQVGKMGVDTIVDGILPDGHTYDYMKRREQ